MADDDKGELTIAIRRTSARRYTVTVRAPSGFRSISKGHTPESAEEYAEAMVRTYFAQERVRPVPTKRREVARG